jgi:predicted acetyltransferase
MWERLLESPKEPVHAFILEEGGRAVGYTVFTQQRKEGIRYDLWVRDHAANTPGALRRLRAFYASFRSIANHVYYYGPHHDALAWALDEQVSQPDQRWDWMLRVVEPAAAIAARGWPNLRARIELELADEQIAANRGRFVFELADGRASLSPGGAGHVRLDVRGLAALFASALSPADCSALGLLSAAPADHAVLAQVFAGPPAWMPDFF